MGMMDEVDQGGKRQLESKNLSGLAGQCPLRETTAWGGERFALCFVVADLMTSCSVATAFTASGKGEEQASQEQALPVAAGFGKPWP